MADKRISELPQAAAVGDDAMFAMESSGIAYHATAKQINSGVNARIDGIKFNVSDPITGGANNYVTLSLMVDGKEQRFDLMINGNVDISGQLSAQALYTTLGDIANLKVDALSTSRRIPKYLAGDTGDDNYIDIEGQNIVLRRAWTDGSTEQARDPYGALLYWASDISDASLGADGYPYVDGARVFITTENTGYPVIVYSYDSGDRLKIFFDKDNNYGPRMVWGEGDGTTSGKGRGYIEKPGLSFDVYNLGTDGVKRGMFMGNVYVDIVGQRRMNSATFNTTAKTITLNLEGGVTETMSYTEDSEGNFASITLSDGHTITVTEVS